VVPSVRCATTSQSPAPFVRDTTISVMPGCNSTEQVLVAVTLDTKGARSGPTAITAVPRLQLKSQPSPGQWQMAVDDEQPAAPARINSIPLITQPFGRANQSFMSTA